jgi:dephospho-CoA kinase
MAKMIVGLAAEIASGKGTIAKYIVDRYRGKSYRFSTMLRDLLDRLYLEHSRGNMQTMLTMIRQSLSEDIMARVMVEDIKKESTEVIAIDGVRRLADIKYLHQLPRFKLVFIEEDIKRRYERIVRRGENPDDKQKTFEEFEKEHKQESELQIKDLRKNADLIINNDGSQEDLYAQVDKMVKEINPSTIPRLKSGVCPSARAQVEGSGLMLSGAYISALKGGVWRRRSIK